MIEALFNQPTYVAARKLLDATLWRKTGKPLERTLRPHVLVGAAGVGKGIPGDFLPASPDHILAHQFPASEHHQSLPTGPRTAGSLPAEPPVMVDSL